MTQHHCDHECVCCDYGIVTREEDEVCTITNCINDTRRNTPAPAAPDISKQIKEIRELAQFTKQAWDEREATIRNQTLKEEQDRIIGHMLSYCNGFRTTKRLIMIMAELKSLRTQSTQERSK